MEKIRTASELFAWTYDKDEEVHPAVNELMHLIQDRLSSDAWSLCILHDLGADEHLAAKKTANGVRLTSTPEFERRYNAKVRVTLPLEALKPLLDGSSYLAFQWRGKGHRAR